MFITSVPVDKTPILNDSINDGVVNRTSPLNAISCPPDRLTNVPNAFPKFSTISGGKSSETFPLISYSRNIYLFIFILFFLKLGNKITSKTRNLSLVFS